MLLAIFALISWLIICILAFIPKSFSLTENIILFFLLTMGAVLISTVLSLNLQYIQVSTMQSMFLCYWLSRTIDIPLSLLVCMNLMYGSKSKATKAVVAIATLAVLFLIELLSIKSGVKAYIKWNFYYYLLTMAFLLVLNSYLGKWLKSAA